MCACFVWGVPVCLYFVYFHSRRFNFCFVLISPSDGTTSSGVTELNRTENKIQLKEYTQLSWKKDTKCVCSVFGSKTTQYTAAERTRNAAAWLQWTLLRKGETAVATRLPGRPPAGCPSGPGAAESGACTGPPHCCTEITNKDDHNCMHQQLTLKIPNTGSHTIV